MSKKAKNVNPYEKKKKRSLKITRKQWIAIICVVSVAAVIGGIVLGNKLFNNDPHAGHNHGDLPEGHYEGDGHDHSSPDANGHSHGAASTDKVKYQTYTNADKTYRVVFRDNAGKAVAEFDKIAKQPIRETINADEGIYELSWSSNGGPNDYEAIYYNVKTGQVSQQFHAPRGTNGVRIAYGNEDQTKIIVQDIFNKKDCKEYALSNPTPDENGDIIVGGAMKDGNKSVMITYYSEDLKEKKITVPLE